MSVDVPEFVNKPVRVELMPGGAGPSIIEGNLYTVDPVSGDLVLLRFEKNEPQGMCLFPRASVKRVTAAEESSACCRPSGGEVGSLMGGLFHNEVKWDAKDVEDRRVALMKWLKGNGIGVEYNPPALVIYGAARVEPPYTEDDCYCDNPIILSRVKSMVNRFQMSNC